jgi:zinc protease
MAALDELYGLGFDHYKKLEPEIEAITADHIRRVATKYFQQPYVLATVRPPLGPGAKSEPKP